MARWRGPLVARALSVPETTPVIRLERLRLADGTPMALEVSHLVADRVPGLLDLNLGQHSLYELLRQRFGIELVGASQSLEAMLADPHEARALHVREGDPLLRLERVTLDGSGRPVEFMRSVYRADRYRFTVQLVR